MKTTIQPEQKQVIEEFQARLLNLGFSLIDGKEEEWTLFRQNTEGTNELDIILSYHNEMTINGKAPVDIFLLNCPHFSQEAKKLLSDALNPEEYFAEINGIMYVFRMFYNLKIFEADMSD